MYNVWKKKLAAVLFIGMLMATAFSNFIVGADSARTLVEGTKNYTITNPYQSINWSTFGHYKAALHTHTTESDGKHSPADVVEEHYRQGFDVLALTDHNFVSTTWDRADRPKSKKYLTPERLLEISKGTDRNYRGMTAIPFANEQSRSEHINTFWADFNNQPGASLEENIRSCEELSGLSHFNHPGRYTGGSRQYGEKGAAASSKPETVAKYVNLLRKYPSCVGLEIININDRGSASDRILWDNILKETMPNRPVWGFSNDDSHSFKQIGISYNMMVMPENNLKSVRQAMEKGTFYAVATVARRELGESFEGSGPIPRITRILVNQDTNTITIIGENYTMIEWIADGKIISEGNTIDINRCVKRLI